MRPVAVLLASMLVAPATGWAQQLGRESLRDAAERGGRELAGKSVAAPNDRWSRVRKLTPGSLIRVVASDGIHRDLHFVTADERKLIAVDAARLPRAARDELLDVVRRFPGTLPVDGRQVRSGKLHLDASGVYFDGARLADLDAIQVMLPRDAIGGINTRVPDSRALLGAAAGGAAGGFLGFHMLVAAAMKPCGQYCKGEKALLTLGGVALPIGGAVVGGLAARRGDTWRRIY